MRFRLKDPRTRSGGGNVTETCQPPSLGVWREAPRAVATCCQGAADTCRDVYNGRYNRVSRCCGSLGSWVAALAWTQQTTSLHKEKLFEMSVRGIHSSCPETGSKATTTCGNTPWIVRPEPEDGFDLRIPQTRSGRGGGGVPDTACEPTLLGPPPAGRLSLPKR